MERSQYFLIGQTHTLLQSFPQSSQADSVSIIIYDVTNSATDVNTSMTAIGNNSWKYDWTPGGSNTYLIKFRNSTIDVDYYLYAIVSGEVVGVPGGSGSGSTLTTLRSEFLKLIDNYNGNDLTGTNSSGELADLNLNLALQTIYSDIKNSRYLDAYASTGLVSTASQAYIELSAISDLDDLFAIKDTTNQYTLEEIPAWKYFLERPNPSNVSGTPYRFCRISNRVYLDPVPTSAITYTTQYKKTYAYLTTGSDVALIPAKFNPWIYAEARVGWLIGEDINATGAIQIAQLERERVRDIFLSDIGSQFARASQSTSAFRRYGLRLNPYDTVT